MKAREVLDAVRRHHAGAAFVPEVELTVDDLHRESYDDLNGNGHKHYSRRIDALMFHQLQRTAIEIKVSTADAARDTYAKVDPWRRITHRFVYAVPAGLIDHPPVYGMGLWWVHEDGRVEVHRKATPNRYPEPLPQHVVQTLAYRASGGPRGSAARAHALAEVGLTEKNNEKETNR
ncbi:hypothetical protein [Pseudactinotalea sp.]|uniref:hypothetical protein n=1 Tax=Pseudactinotalea sp. TaxID=1926260 RepID=UPI003B3AF11D